MDLLLIGLIQLMIVESELFFLSCDLDPNNLAATGTSVFMVSSGMV